MVKGNRILKLEESSRFLRCRVDISGNLSRFPRF